MEKNILVVDRFVIHFAKTACVLCPMCTLCVALGRYTEIYLMPEMKETFESLWFKSPIL